jgi:hypothetical protein
MGKKKNDSSLSLMEECITDAKALMEISLFNAQEKLKERFTPQLKSLIAKRLQQEEDEIEDDELDSEIEDEEDVAISKLEDAEADIDMGDDDEEDIDIDIEEEEDDEYTDDDEEDIDIDIEEEDDEYTDDDEEDEEINIEAIMKQMSAITEDEEEDIDIDIEDDEEEDIDIDVEDDEEEDIDIDIDDEEEDIDIDIDDEEDIDIDIDDEEDTEQLEQLERTNRKLRNELRKYKAGTRIFKEKIAEQKFVQAKLLYVNDMLKRKHISEIQKYKIVEAFDRARNISDIKLIYKTLFEAYKERQKKIKEAKSKNLQEGVSSRTMIVNKKQRIIENKNSNPMKDRFQVLANIKKK